MAEAGQTISKLGAFFTKYVPTSMPIFEKKSHPICPVDGMYANFQRGGPTTLKVGEPLNKICHFTYAQFLKKKMSSDTSCGISQSLPNFLM